ncbi:hypothetical protein KIS4809_0718 [Bacillus sp. ZZV12-4809]|nr:hypothetical protein KIS4809_0718 [Bacillus sp. ZZV12-4809]
MLSSVNTRNSRIPLQVNKKKQIPLSKKQKNKPACNGRFKKGGKMRMISLIKSDLSAYF